MDYRGDRHSGSLAAADASEQQTMDAWTDSVNASGGIDGHLIKFIDLDDAANPATGLADAQKLVEQDHAIVGEYSVIESVWGPYVTKVGIPVIGGTGINSLGPDFFFTGTTDNQDIASQFAMARKEGGTKSADFYCAESPTCAEETAAIKTAAQAEGDPSVYETSVSSSSSSYTPQCLAATAAGLNAVSVGEDSNTVIRVYEACAQQGYKPIPIQGTTTVSANYATQPLFQWREFAEDDFAWFDDSNPGRPLPALRRPEWSTPLRVQLGGGLGVSVLLLLVRLFAGSQLTQWSTMLTVVILFLSLGLLVRTSGQVSLCQLSFGAIGAVAFSKFASGLGVPWIPALILAGLVAMPIGAVLAIPAIRSSGLYLALATFGFGLVLQDMFYNTNVWFGSSGLGIAMPRPSLSRLHVGTDTGFYYVILAIVAVVVAAVISLTQTRFGSLLIGKADSPLALATNAVSTTSVRVSVFCISAFLAATSGALAGMVLQIGTPDSFPNDSKSPESEGD
jgi:ABC-type branched-subunit amino acid transport system permease subunit